MRPVRSCAAEGRAAPASRSPATTCWRASLAASDGRLLGLGPESVAGAKDCWAQLAPPPAALSPLFVVEGLGARDASPSPRPLPGSLGCASPTIRPGPWPHRAPPSGRTPGASSCCPSRPSGAPDCPLAACPTQGSGTGAQMLDGIPHLAGNRTDRSTSHRGQLVAITQFSGVVRLIFSPECIRGIP